ncbi:major facilitator superfamily domain-containing protein [Mrakia frigida]|uniref:major facilitator superfamily domain-containing protein n=1 Tax=Mrakia frigida TaxID=29902 RepID=UPI003FCC1D04
MVESTHRTPSTHSDIELSPLPRSTTPAQSLKEEGELSSTLGREPSSLPPSLYSRPSSPFDQPSTRVAVALPPTDGGRAAYTFLLGAFLIEALVWGFPFSFSNFQAYYLAPDGPYPKDQGLITLTGTLSSGVTYMSALAIFPVLERKPRWRRPCLYIGFVTLIAGLTGSGFAKSPAILVLTQGLLFSLGGSILYAPVISYMHEWWVRRTGFAYGVITAGTSISGIVFPFIIEALLRRFGSGPTLWGLGLVLFVLIGSLLPYIKGRLPDPPRTQEARREAPPQAFDYSFFTRRKFWILWLANLFQALGYFLPTLFISLYAAKVDEGNASLGSISLATINATAIISRVSFGSLSDNPKFTLPLIILSCVGSGVSVLLIWGLGASTTPGLIGFSAAFGVFSGGFSSLWAAMIREVGVQSPAQAATLYGIFSFGRGLGSVLGAPISTVLLNSSPLPINYGMGEYGKLIVFTGTSLVVAGMIGGSAGGWKLKSSARRD